MTGGFLRGLAAWLDEAGVGRYTPEGPVAGPWPICLEALPPEPAEAVALAGTGGTARVGGQPWGEPAFLVRVRGGADTSVSRAKCREVIDALHGLSYVSLADGIYLVDCLCQVSEPVHSGPDAAGMQMHTATFRASIEYPLL